MKMKCEQCGQEFDPANRAGPGTKDGALVQMRYCSRACARKAQNRRAYDRRKNGKHWRRQLSNRELAEAAHVSEAEAVAAITKTELTED